MCIQQYVSLLALVGPPIVALINVAAGLGAITGPLVIGALTQQDPVNGWRKFYWVQTAFWGFSVVGILVGYLPPKRTFDQASVMQKLGRIDWIGSALLTAAIALFVAGFNLVSVFEWSSAKVLGPLVTGIVAFIVFGLYEAFGTKTGILPPELFQGGGRQGWAFAIFCFLFFIEGITFYAIITFYPALTSALFTQDPLGGAVRFLPLFAASSAFTAVYGWASSHFKDIKYCMLVGFALKTAGIVGLATVQPGQAGVAIGCLTLSGVGLAGPLVLVLAGLQLSVPHHLIATGTALVVSSRTLAGSIFVAAYSTALSQRLSTYIPSYIVQAVIPAGLPPQSIGPFIGAFASGARDALAQIPGVTPAVIGAAAAGAYQQAFADGVRVVFIIATPFGLVGCILCLLLPSFKDRMDYLVEAPLEDLHKHRKHESKV
ncbi:putative major facilitator transporter Str1/Tri12, MFS transporter superfamily [Septoria linicola]|nr:putative major facilitator transporter Str1/Tri12, MFS transporter superfamily [Septoria linicola]